MTERRDVLDFLDDILSAMEAALEFTAGMDAEQFRCDRKTAFAIVRALEIVGEATKQIPDSVRARYPNVPWRQMAGMRDRLIHGYATVDLDIVWQTVMQDITTARPRVREALQREQNTACE